jgi:hypothetical protein
LPIGNLMKLNYDIDKIIEEILNLGSPFNVERLDEISSILTDVFANIGRMEADLLDKLNFYQLEIDKIDSDLQRITQKKKYNEDDFLNNALYQYLRNNDVLLKRTFWHLEEELIDENITPDRILEYLNKIKRIYQEIKYFMDENITTINFINKEYVDQLEKTLELQEKTQRLILGKEMV